jgi:uncharacterized membrane protein
MRLLVQGSHVILQAPIYNILIMAIWSTLATTAVITAMAGLASKPLHAPVQAISHIVFGKQSYELEKRNLTFLLVGLVLNIFAMLMWSGAAEFAIRAFGIAPRNIFVALLVAFGVTVISYIVDFHVVPKRFTPGFEHILDKRALLVVYTLLGLSLFCGAMGRIA